MKYLDLLGYPVVDMVTGFKGVVEAVSYDLYGCIQVIVRPTVDDKGKMDEPRWFDAKRLIKSGTEPAMPVPEFDSAIAEGGAAEKPIFR